MTLPGRLWLSLLAVGLLTGCATLHEPEVVHWMDYFTPEEDITLETPPPAYDIRRVESDYQALVSLTRELENISREMAAMKRAFVFRETPYLQDHENKQVEFLLFRLLNVRDALWDMSSFYRKAHSPDPDTHTRGSIIGMSAGLNLIHYSSRFVALFMGEPELIRLINAAHPRYEIPAKMYDTLLDRVTAIENLELVNVIWYLFCKAQADSNSALSRIRDLDPRYAALIARMDDLYAGAHIQTGYILHVTRSPVPELINRLEHSRIARLGDQVGQDMRHGAYKVRGFVFKDVARIKRPGSQLLQFTDTQVKDIKARLQPGDLLFTYTSGYMSNVFLPGVFKHGITYLGTIEDRRRAGLTDEILARHAVSDRQRQALIEYTHTAETPDGRPADVVEAVAEGVVLHSLEEILATHVNRLVVIRPRFSEQERLEQLIAVLQYVGADYDFEFDFQDDTYQCCTELIYRTTNRLGTIDYSLVKMRGLWILAADDILTYFLDHNPGAFDFVVLAEQAPDRADMSAALYEGPEGLQRLRQLMNHEMPIRSTGTGEE